MSEKKNGQFGADSQSLVNLIENRDAVKPFKPRRSSARSKWDYAGHRIRIDSRRARVLELLSSDRMTYAQVAEIVLQDRDEYLLPDQNYGPADVARDVAVIKGRINEEMQELAQNYLIRILTDMDVRRTALEISMSKVTRRIQDADEEVTADDLAKLVGAQSRVNNSISAQDETVMRLFGLEAPKKIDKREVRIDLDQYLRIQKEAQEALESEVDEDRIIDVRPDNE